VKTRKVAVLGATGVVGQRFIQLLERHPWFRVGEVVASDASRGKPYALATRWTLEGDVPDSVRDLEVKGLDSDLDADIAFSALPSGTAAATERACARRGYPVFTNASDLRTDEDVPIVVPEVNPDHMALVEPHAGEGFIVANGNCTSIILALVLKPLVDRFGVEACHVVTMQALSGAGYPGVPSLDSLANVIPYIPGEEEKVEAEAHKILGTVHGNHIVPARFPLSATCTRVPVLEGHTEAVSVRLSEQATVEGIVDAVRSFRGNLPGLTLPSAPLAPITYRTEHDRPQPRRDSGEAGGMAIVMGRLRPDPVLGWRFLVTGSNTVRGAAGGSILTAELAVASGLA
jgi:aspartate-semialdehyde dehydrogenase